MRRNATLLILSALAAVTLNLSAAAAQPNVKAKSSGARSVPMHPDTLTLYPKGRPQKHRPAYSYTRHRFDQAVPVHGTFSGPRM